MLKIVLLSICIVGYSLAGTLGFDRIDADTAVGVTGVQSQDLVNVQSQVDSNTTSIGGLVPYSGATKNVALGNNTLSALGINTFGLYAENFVLNGDFEFKGDIFSDLMKGFSNNDTLVTQGYVDDKVDTKEDSLPATPSDPSSKYLNGNKEWSDIGSYTSQYTDWTTNVISSGTNVISSSWGNQPRLELNGDAVIDIDLGSSSDGLHRLTLSLWSGTNSVAWLTNNVDFAEAPELSTNAYNTILIRKTGSSKAEGRQL